MSSTSRPDSPCVAVCTTLYDEFCRGCGRHYLEVANWNQMVDDKKQEVWDRIAQAVLVECPQVQIVEVNELSDTTRGVGGFGSTGV